MVPPPFLCSSVWNMGYRNFLTEHIVLIALCDAPEEAAAGPAASGAVKEFVCNVRTFWVSSEF